jgi:hypothetical protein
MSGRRVFHQQDHRAAIFSAGAETLYQPQQHQEDRCPDADHRVGRQTSDQHGADPDKEQGRDQDRLAAVSVPQITKHKSAERSRDKADAEARKRQQDADQGIEPREECFAEH